MQVYSFEIAGSGGRHIAAGLTLPRAKDTPLVIYAHGFNGFKDWGGMDLVAERFADSGFAFLKFNFSHNGTSPKHPEEFVDLEAYAANTYSRELEDLRLITDWASTAGHAKAYGYNAGNIGLIGHSRGGGMAILFASEDPRIKALATWAAVSACKTPWGSWSAEKLEAWKKDGVAYIRNGRTGQDMPLNYSLYEDYQQHTDRLNIEAAAKSMQIPWLIVHGTADTSVTPEAAARLQNWQPNAESFLLDTDHVFGRKHPWEQTGLPQATASVLARTTAFFAHTLKE